MEKQWGHAYRTTMVCIDDAEHGVMQGRLYNPYVPEGRTFRSVMEFILMMEKLLDEMQFPQSFEALRAFRDQPERAKALLPDTTLQKGKRGTFSLRVLFRQNASWQGSVCWLEGEKEESFRSVLELLLLMNSALGEAGDNDGK